jgi:hypothetical protein
MRYVLPLGVAFSLTLGCASSEVELCGKRCSAERGCGAADTCVDGQCLPDDPVRRSECRAWLADAGREVGPDGGDVPGALGTACTATDGCTNGFCVDGVCCATECAEACAVCEAGTGACVAVSSGTEDLQCGAYRCSGEKACRTTCATTGDCATGASCSGGVCAGDKALGIPCAWGFECASGHCASGVCCDTACTGGCQACSAAAGATNDGTCALLSPAVVCRASGGPCDRAETCTGTQPECPVDGYEPAGTSCDDGDPCTQLDSCAASGVCLGTPLACDSPPNVQCYSPSGTCTSGQCVYAAVAPGTACSAGDLCTSGETCNASAICGGGTGCGAGTFCGPSGCTPCLIGYRDQDGDNYGAGAPTTFCQASLPAGWVSTPGDCYDLNAKAHPGQTQAFSNSRGDGSYDYDCDGAQTLELNCLTTLPVEGCFTTKPSGTKGWKNALPACGTKADIRTCGWWTCLTEVATTGGCSETCVGTPDAVMSSGWSIRDVSYSAKCR